MDQLGEFLHFLRDPSALIKWAGYVGLTLIVFTETGLFFGFFLPGDSLLVTAGLLSSQGFPLNVWKLGLLLSAAAIAGDNTNYWIGRTTGPRIFRREDSLFFKKRHVERASAFYARHGPKTIVLARFMPIVRTFAPVVAGMAAMDYRRFVLYTIVGALVWAVGVTWLGYFLGSLIPEAGKYLEYIIILIVLASIAPPAIHLLRDRARSKTTLTRA